KQDHKDVLNGKTIVKHDDLFIREDGRKQWLSYELKPWRNRDGEVGGIIMFTADISHLKKTTYELEQALEKSDKQNHRLQNFAHIVSHNLRSHSSNISLLVDLLSQDFPEVMKNEYVQMIAKANSNLTTTLAHLNEVTQINKLEGQKMEWVDLKEYVLKTIKLFQVKADKNHVKLINKVLDSPRIKVVPAYLESILLNLISNAIKYRDEQKESFVLINISKGEKYLLLSVKDNGLGLNTERHQHKIFGLYKTFHDHPEATGVGLFMTKNQVEAMGGTIELISEPGVGTTMNVRLPYDQTN
ncbi:MAG: ATP-binding protein, partial [Bacteroidota bacterium]